MKFNINDKATYTESKFINALLRAIYIVRAADTKRIAAYLALDERLLNGGLRLACGMNLTELRAIVTIATAARLHAKDPKSSLDEIAFYLVFRDRSSV